MSKAEGVRWRCLNRDCNWSFLARIASETEAPPRCACGGPMKQEDPVIVFTYLDFLRVESAAGDQAPRRAE